ncbi:hypothetical protein HW555_003834 [Spodoptera exigua]|uniref:Uncharacterized protein n=1 Tax=Spodoptera exigua TaxID=7107 RepID=A0A835GM61_SPOEX|nr:hypothetical protein HW555_003834 [Spodoptera exigua]
MPGPETSRNNQKQYQLTLLLPGLVELVQFLSIGRALESRMLVEEVGDERQVELVHSGHDVRGSHEGATPEFRGLLQHQLSTTEMGGTPKLEMKF